MERRLPHFSRWLWTLFLFQCTALLGLAQPTREGSIDLTASQGRYILINDDASNSGLGIEGGSFTFEAWVYMTENNNSNFNLFRFRSGNRYLCLSYRGDDKKNTDEVWYVETEGLPEKGGKGDSWNWWFGYKSGFTAPTFLNQWHHVAFTCDNGSTVRLFIDGQPAINSTNLVHNGSELASLFPYDGDGNCAVGAQSKNKDIEGKMYVGEVRLWDAQLSSSEIAKYYDEEVNKAHPHWNDLIRYYHGTESSGSGSSRKFEDRSPKNEYDATVSNSDVGVSSDYSPTVKPPSFNDSDFNISFTANDCQTSDIDVSWSDFEASSWGYENANGVYYKVTRDSDGATLYSGTGNSKSDTDVSEGDKHRYKLQTYWKIDGNEVYSDDVIYSDYGTIKMQYDAPTNLGASTDNCDKTIDLSWSASDGTPPLWRIQRSNNSSFSSGNTYMTSNLDGGTTSYTASNQTVETSRYFRVQAYGTDDNGCSVSGTWSSGVEGNTSYPASAPTNMTITQDLPNKTLKLDWTNPSGNNADSWIIKRKKFDGTDEVEFTTALGTTKYDDADLELCQTFSYTIGAVNECASDGNFATTDLTGNISTDLSDAIKNMEASKGYFSDAVQLEWEMNGSLSNIDRFRVYRSRADKNDFSLLKVLDNDLVFTDETAIGGTFYNYKVVGEAGCEDNTIYTNEGIDMGFMIPFGVANGHVEYEGGNPVEDVTVNFEKQSSNSSGHSLEFDGSNDYVLLDEDVRIDNRSFTIEFWEKRTKSSRGFAVGSSVNASEANKTLYIGYTNANNFIFAFHANDLSASTTYDSQWHHWACVYDQDATGDNRFIYKDGELVASNRSESDFLGTDPLTLAYVERNNLYKGFLDEVRVWNVARTEEQIMQNYNRIINGSEEGLTAYYRCDEGIGDHVYDASKTDDEFNKNDGVFVRETSFSTEIPSTDLLGIRAVTNEYGDYTIDYIPYKSGGEIFKVTPSIGQHVFEPNSRTVYVGDGAQTQNGLDFTDISSFSVAGKVTYQNSQVPVEGVAILIDGQQAVGVDNQPVRTDANGDYTISVPIGYHYISTQMEGHTFDEGIFPPLNAYGDIELYEFTEDITINFSDDTKIKVAGRVVGGTREGDKEIGLGLSLNNIGVSDIEFRLQKEGYDLDVNDNAIYDLLSVTTDPYTGEYEIEMIPEQWIVEKAGNDTYFLDASDIPVLDLRSSLTENIVIDTNALGVLDTFAYHHKLNYVIRQTPRIEVLDANDNAFVGDTVLYFNDQETGEADTLYIGSNNPFAHHVFTQGQPYEAHVFLEEVYLNPNHPDGAVVDQVPVNGATITINNNLMVNPSAVTGTTDENGEYVHSFMGGVPSLSVDGENTYTSTFEVDANTGSISVKWNDNEPFRGHILGALPIEGTDFITSGPEIPEIVLRDPPGTNSYAYMEQGSSYTTTKGWNFEVGSTSSFDIQTVSGLKMGFGGGLAGPFTETEYIQDAKYGIELTKEYNTSGEYSETYTFTERIETSSDAEDVGSDADLYIGKGTNFFMNQSKNLRVLDRDFCIANGLDFYDTGNEKVLGILEGYVMNDETSTFFIYSQKHILYELIPDMINIRDNLFTRPEYTSNFPANSSYFGLNNDNENVYKAKDLSSSTDTTELSYTFTPSFAGQIDSVRVLNQQITIWLDMIALNEEEKANAEVVQNLSIDGSTGAYTSEIKEERTSAFDYRRTGKIEFYSESQAGFITGGNGFKMNYNFDVDLALKTNDGQSATNSITFGYVIDERDEGDYYSIDVKKNNGVKYSSREDFMDFLPDKSGWVNDQVKGYSIAGGVGAARTALYVGSFYKFVGKATTKVAANRSAYIGAAFFTADLGLHIYDMVNLAIFRDDVHKDSEGNNTYRISGFNISSPIFTVRGGQSRCPYEGGEISMFYMEDEAPVDLHVATLRREVPVLDVSPAIVSNVPEDESAVFTLKLQNESESNTDVWYSLGILEETNPNGAILLVDGLSADRAFLVPAWETVTKTLTLSKGLDDVMEYDSIGVILRSMCQYDPANIQADIADTVYVSAHFLPECTDVEIGNMNENWIVNYSSDDQVSIKLEGYDLNQSTLERVDFQYKSLSGNPIAVKAYFPDTTSDAYQDYTGAKEILDGSSESFIWDISALTDRAYMIRARATCADGSVTESDYLTGLIDRQTPVVFGTPNPTDGILSAGEDISIRFNEELEAGLVKDHNISVRGVLNGADVSHGTSVQFDGIVASTEVPSVSLNNKSFTVEYWLRRDAGTAGTAFAKGSGEGQVQMDFDASGNLNLAFGTNTYSIDASTIYNTTYPENAWHHYAVSYDKDAKYLAVYGDDQILLTQSDVEFLSTEVESLYLGTNVAKTSPLKAKIHELRIWEEARSFGQVVSNMSVTLSGRELDLYGYWPMDEGTGTLAEDKTASRHMNVNGTWALSPSGYAMNFDGAYQYLELDGQNIVIDDETDFAIEFWFKGAQASSDQTLFSSGWGDGIEGSGNPAYGMAITANASGQIKVLNNGFAWTAVSKNVMDDQWHHFALSVDRRANAKVYIDGGLQAQSASANFSGLAGAKMWVGARGKATSPSTQDVDQLFDGQMDEIRVWNSARKAELVSLYKNTKLDGNEIGLVAYYPFETYDEVMGTIVLNSTLDDQLNSNLWVNGLTASANYSVSYGSGPAVKDVRPMQDIPFDFVVNGDEIVITPTIDASRIEGQVLEISVLDIQDLNGNRMLSPKTWTALMEQNVVVWQESDISVNIAPNTGGSFTAVLANLSGVAYDYSLDNIPAWLSTDAETGVIPANSTKEIVFEINEGLNTGSYSQGINLSTILGFDEKLNVNVRVAPEAPNWSVDAKGYQYTMSIIGQLFIKDVASTDTYDMVAVFVGDECRGVANVEYKSQLDAYQVYLNVYSNEALNPENLDFRVWDASTGNIHGNVTPDLDFIPNGIVGTILAPQEIRADENISTTIELGAGWNWISLNLESDALNSVDSLFHGIGEQDDLVKGQDGFDIYDETTGWFGSLTMNGGLEIGEMYKVFVAQPTELEVVGVPAKTANYPIAVDSGWNWVGMVPQVSMTLDEALASLQPTEGDLIKGQNSFAMYSSTLGWIGSLNSLEPTEGYMLQSATGGMLTYPQNSVLATARIAEESVELPAEWVTEMNRYEGNMTLLANIANGESLDGSEILVAFVDGECRGYASPMKLDGNVVYFLTVNGESSTEKVSFKLYHEGLLREVDITNIVAYAGDKVLGSLNSPFALRVAEDAVIDEAVVMPNPFNESLTIVLPNVEDADIEVQLISTTGITLYSASHTSGSEVVLDASIVEDLASGAYIVRMVGASFAEERLVIKK